MYMWHREDPIRIYPRNRNNIEHTSTYKKVEKLFKKAVNQTRYWASEPNSRVWLLCVLPAAGSWTLRSQTPESVSHFEDLVKIGNTYNNVLWGTGGFDSRKKLGKA